MHDKIFISYAKEDYRFAESLYTFLESNNFRPWLDKKGILPGQDWNFIIRKSLREANFIILLLSDISVQKRGYVQREFKLALEYYEEKLEDDIYLLPLKINDCQVPDRLSKFQWIEYDSKDCFDLLLQALNAQRQKHIDIDRKLVASKELFSYTEIEKFYEYNNKISFNIETNYFKFDDESNQNLSELNAIIKGKVTSRIVDARKDFYKLSGNIIDFDHLELNWVYDTSYSPNFISKSIISINSNTYSFTGGAHGNGNITGLNYHLDPLFIINLEEIFSYEDHHTVLEFLSTYCFEELKKLYVDWLDIDTSSSDFNPATIFWEGSLAPDWKNFSNYFISRNGLEIIFNTYSVSSYAFGSHIIPILYEKFLEVIKEPKKLQDLMSKLN